LFLQGGTQGKTQGGTDETGWNTDTGGVMTFKQLAERLGVSPQQLNFELDLPCRLCKRLGGNEPPCEKCEIVATVRIQEPL